MDLYRVVPLRENLWAISEVGKTVMYVINGKTKHFCWTPALAWFR